MLMSFDDARRRKTRQGAGELISVSLTFDFLGVGAGSQLRLFFDDFGFDLDDRHFGAAAAGSADFE